MSSITEQISATSKSQLESQLNFLNSVLKSTVDSASQIATLNLATARNAAERSTAAARQLIEAKDARGVLELARPLSAIEGLVAYQQEVFSIASKTQQALLQTATDRFRDVPATTLALVAPAVAQTTEAAANAIEAATNAAAEAAQSAASGATGAAAHAAQAAGDAAQAATGSAVEVARTATDAATDAAAEGVRATAEEIDDAAEATARATHDATESTSGSVQSVAATATTAVESASATIAKAAEPAPEVQDAVTAAAARVTEAATAAPASVTAPLFEVESPASKTVRNKPSAKPAAEAVAALADKHAAPSKGAPGKSRK